MQTLNTLKAGKKICTYSDLKKTAPRNSQRFVYVRRKAKRHPHAYPPVPAENIERAAAISKLICGNDAYPLRTASSLIYLTHGDQKHVTLQGLPARLFQGTGRNRGAALTSLLHQIHSQYQRLFKTLPMQRTARDEQLWKALDSVIRTEQYRRDRKTILPVTATLKESMPEGMTLDWFGGSTLFLPLEILEGEWSTISVGDWCEAVLVRRAGDGEILKATFVRQIPAVEPFSDEEAAAWHAALPAANLPSSLVE